MHERHQEDGEHKRHMWRHTADVTREAEPKTLICVSEAGQRKVGVGDCALFQAGNAPPYIGIIRKLLAEQEGDLNLRVNWLYRPGDVELGKQALLEAEPNEIFYSFDKDEISASSLLHPCKVAFLQKGVELPLGISSFVCRRAYDTANHCLYWLTDQADTDERQAELNELLKKTNREMHIVVSSQKTLEQPKVDGVNMSSHAGQVKSKKRERTDHNLESNKREKSMKADDFDPSLLKREFNITIEEINDKDGGLKLTESSVDHLVELMLYEQKDSLKKPSTSMSRRISLANIIVAMDKEDLLSRFIQLGGIPVLDDWLQEVHKGKAGDSGSPKESDKASEELLLVLLRALEKLPVDLDVLKTCLVGKSVNNLRSHRNLEIQKKARKLVETWKRRVDAEMKSSDEQKLGTNPSTSWSCKQPVSEVQGSKGRSPTDRANAKSSISLKGHMSGGCHKEPAGGKLRTLGNDKVTGSTSLEKGSGESLRTENVNSQRLIVRLPNPGRSPANSASGGSLADGGLSYTQGSSPSFLERCDGMDVKSKALAIRSLEGGKAGKSNGNNIEKAGNVRKDEKEGSCLASGERSCVASADEADCKSSDAIEHGCKEVKQGNAHNAAGVGVESKNLDSDNRSSDRKMSLELNENSVCLLASLATCDGLEAEKSVSGVSMEELPSIDLHGSRDFSNQGSCFSNTELHNQIVQGGEKSEKDNLANVAIKGSPGLASVDGGQMLANPLHDLKGSGESLKEQPDCSTGELSQEERSRDSAVEQHTLNSRDSFSERNLSARVGSQDEDEMAAGEGVLIESSCRLSRAPAVAIGESLRASLEEPSVECEKISESNLISPTDLCKEEALELVQKVLNKDVEPHGQQAGVCDKNSHGPCTAEPKHEDGAHDSAESPKEAVNVSATNPRETNCCTDAVAADSLGLVVPEGMTAADGVPSVDEEGKADQISGHHKDAQNLGEGFVPACGSHDDVKMESLGMDENGQGSSVAILAAAPSTVTTLQPAEGHGLSEVASLPKGDDKDKSKDVRPVFDLNEGLISDDTTHENGSQSKVCVSISSVAVPDVSLGPGAQPSSLLAAPVAVVAATRGAFVPPSSPLRIKGELGWKGSAATSAFRRAEPRRVAEITQVSQDVTAVVDSVCHSGKRARILDIDLNVADEKVLEDTSNVTSLQALPSGSVLVNSSLVPVRPELDLNRIDESEDGMGHLSESRNVDQPVQASSSLAARPVVRDFDLNDGLDLNGCRMEEPPPPSTSPSHLSNGNSFQTESSGVAALAGAKSHSEIAWYSAAAANPLSSVVPAYTIGRSETSYPPSSATSVLSPGHHLSPYSTDIYQGGVVFSSSAISYSTTIPTTPVAPAISFSTNMPSASPVVSFSTTMPAGFSYAGYSFGSGFPFTSASYNMGTAPYVTSSNSSIYPSTPSQLLNAGAVMSSYRRPYPPSVPDGSGPDNSVSWPRPSLDMNAGPNLTGDADVREDSLGSRNAPSQLAFQQSGSLNGPVKRKESDGSFDPFRSGFKQMTWR